VKKEIETNAGVIRFKTVKSRVWYDLLKERQQTGDDILFSQKLIIASIESWDLKDEKGNILPINLDNFLDNVDVSYLNNITEIVKEINNLPKEEKKTL